MKKTTTTLLSLVFLAMPLSHSFADDINYGSIEDAGFSNVSKILQDMTPEQRAAVEAQAKSMMPELQSMSQAEIDAFTQQLLSMENSIDMSKINAKSLDAKKSKNLGGIKQDIDNYLSK